ncbi:MAG: ATP-dependent Clp protease adaptor ClpS [Muribaculaceae bacterium]|nr:ATP-dependent Clp protease adaptor ClpS [Muribaculaceae bacterium]
MAKQQGSVKERERVFTNFPKHYKVIFHNDDFTTMEFVVKVLMEVFYKSESDATAIMLAVHEQGRGVAGIYSYDIALSKANKATAMAKAEGFPLRITVEPE